MIKNTIENSGLFDSEYYLSHNIDVATLKFDPLDHYLEYGYREGRAPGPFFDPQWYLSTYTDVAEAQCEPLYHYIKYGRNEGRIPTPQFDVAWYESKYLDASIPPLGGLCHYAKYGRYEKKVGRFLMQSTPPTQLHGKEEPIEFSWDNKNLKIAVVIHLYYLDILPEICSFLKNIPYQFTAMFAIPDKSYIRKAKSILDSYRIECTKIFKVSQNKGRNFGPFLVDFRKEILEHDIFLHLHTKKSLRTGSEQNRWRHWLYNGILGSELLVRGILHKYATDPKVGIIYPPIFSEHAYWYHSWHGSLHQGINLFNKLGIEDFDRKGLIDFPCGGMFWARTQSLKKLLEYPWSYDDFEKEPTYHDGTLPHALERSICFIAKDAGFDFHEIDAGRGIFRANWSEKLLSRYDDLKDSLEYCINNYDTISFDFYDTIVCRICATPDDVHNYIGWVLYKRDLIKDDSLFYTVRKNSETLARDQATKGDVDIDDIYNCFNKCCSWSQDVISLAKELELSIEEKVLRLRPDIVNYMRRAHAMGKRVIVVSDTYMPLSFFHRVTKKLGIADSIDHIYVSSETGKRKDRGDVWSWLFHTEKREKFVHIGDNEESDTHIPIVQGIAVCPILNTTVLSDLRGLSCSKKWKQQKTQWRDGIVVGPAIAYLGQNAFSQAGNFSPAKIDNPIELGYAIFGPIIFGFLTWIAENSISKKIDTIAFFAREGYFLIKWYKYISKLMGKSGKIYPEAKYFPISRRLAIGALQSKNIDIDLILKGSPFRGILEDFLRSRIGYQIDPDNKYAYLQIDTSIEDDKNIIKNILLDLSADIKENSKAVFERLDMYRTYASLNKKNISVVDIGYSGTIQLALSKLFPQTNMAGFYMVTSPEAAQIRKYGGVAYGFFSEEDISKDSVVKNYSLFLEALLTANHGQVIDFRKTVDNKIIPIFGEKGTSQHNFSILNQISSGVERYIKDLLDTFGPEIALTTFSSESCESPFRTAIADRNIVFSNEILQSLHVEDNFCGNGELNAAKVYQFIK